MKSIILNLAILLSASIISCNTSSTQSKEVKVDETKLSDSLNKSETFDSSAYKLEIKLFKHSGLDFDAEGFCVNGRLADKERITEVKSIGEEKVVNCSEGNYIQRIVFKGNAAGVALLFFDKNGKELFKSENVKIENSVSFSGINHFCDDSGLDKKKKEADFADWFEYAAKVQIVYKGQIIKELSWKNNGWFRQAEGFEEGQ